MNLHIQEAQLFSGRTNTKRSTTRHIIMKWLKAKDRVLKTSREVTHYVQGIVNRTNS